MKSKFLIFLFLVSIISANAQDIIPTPKPPDVYLGIGTGLNAYTGFLGISGNLRLTKQSFFQAGLGLGSWGYKYSIGFGYDLTDNRRWALGAGLSYCTGLRNVDMEMEMYNGGTEPVKIYLKSAKTLNLKATHNWIIGRKNTFYVDMGYAVPLQTSPWEITDGSIVSENSRKALDLVSPGGVILGLGFTFGL